MQNKAAWTTQPIRIVCEMTVLSPWFNKRVVYSHVTFAAILINCISYFDWIRIVTAEKKVERRRIRTIRTHANKKHRAPILWSILFFWSTHYVFAHSRLFFWPACLLFIDSYAWFTRYQIFHTIYTKMRRKPCVRSSNGIKRAKICCWHSALKVAGVEIFIQMKYSVRFTWHTNAYASMHVYGKQFVCDAKRLARQHDLRMLRRWDIELVLSEPLIFSKFEIIIALLTQTTI